MPFFVFMKSTKSALGRDASAMLVPFSSVTHIDNTHISRLYRIFVSTTYFRTPILGFEWVATMYPFTYNASYSTSSLRTIKEDTTVTVRDATRTYHLRECTAQIGPSGPRI